MDKNKGKYYNTACLMDEALIQLINEKDYDYITIKEICKRAGVNRSTFYLHYETIDDLLDEATNHFFDNFYEQMHNADKTKKNVKGSIVNNDKDSLMLVNDDYLRPYLTFIKENKKIYQASYKSPMISSSKRQYEMMYNEYFKPIMDIFKIPLLRQKFIFNYHFQGLLAIIKCWVDDGCKESIDEICEIITLCIAIKSK